MNKKYHYTESGLDNVWLLGIGMHPDSKGDETMTLMDVMALHRLIAQGIVQHKMAMSGKELRFLRTELGLSQGQLAKILAKEPITIGRWERGEVRMPEGYEALVRKLAIEKLGLEDCHIEQLTGMVTAGSGSQPIEIEASADGYDLRAA